MKKDKKSNYVWITLRRVFFLTLCFVGFFIPADLAAADGDTVFGPKDFEIGWFRVHISLQRLRMDDPEEGIITIVKSTPEKQIRGGFILFNGKSIRLRDFLSSEELIFEKEVKLRSRNRLLVFLRGTQTASIQVAVKKKAATPAPEVTFSAEPQAIKLDEASTLNWTTSYATSVSIEPGIGTVNHSGSQTVTPTETTTYTLTAEGEGGTISKGVIVTVYQPPTVTISADPETVIYGETTTLYWSSTNADKVVIDQNIGEVSYDGSLEVRPDSTTTYTITASGPGGSAQAKAVVTVKADVEPQPEGTFGEQYEDLIPPDATIGEYDSTRFSLITGLVRDMGDLSIADVSITILDHPEYGTASTDSEGRFSIPVEGGGTLTVVYQKEGLIPAQRKVLTPWNDTAVAETVQMIVEDPATTTLTFDGNPDTVVTHESTEVTDESGSRSLTMVFTGDNSAYEVDAQGNVIQELTTITTRATEYTTPESMPAKLPPNSAYTYCVELSVDGLQRVKFDKPVITWVDNFLGFDVGEIVPVGYYDRDRGVWVPSDNGVVVQLLDTDADGTVDALDKNGDGLADDLDNDGSFSDEVMGLGDSTRYAPGSTFWRFAVKHFSPWDCNWPFGPPSDAIPPNPDGIPDVDQQCVVCKQPCETLTGSFVEDRSRIFHEDIPIPGTAMTFHYASNRVVGYEYKITVPVSGDTVPSVLKRIVVIAEVAGRTFEQALDPLPNQMAEFTWDGLDHLGRRVLNPTTASISVGFVYNAVYMRPGTFAQAFAKAGKDLTPIQARQKIISWKRHGLVIHRAGAREQDLIAEGWTMSLHHHLKAKDPSTLHKGDGTVIQRALIFGTVAGSGTRGYGGDGGPATEADLERPLDVTLDASGNLYIADTSNHRIRKVYPNGIITTVAGTGEPGYTGDGGPAIDAKFSYPRSVTLDTSGNIYFASDNKVVRKVDTNGIITTVAGNGNYGGGGDGGPATAATFRALRSVAVDSSGNLYIADKSSHRIRKVDTNGIITTVAGIGFRGGGGDGGPATEARFSNPEGVAVDGAGNLYIADTGGGRIRKVDTSGIITTVAGNGMNGYSGDGGPATEAKIFAVTDLTVDGSGNLYLADGHANQRIRKVDTNGIITTVVGNGIAGFSGDGGPATEAQLNQPLGVAVDGAGGLYIADEQNNRIRKVASPSAFIASATGEEITFPEESGLGHTLSTSGRHENTFDLDTGVVLYQFGYDGNNKLVSITDQFGNQTVIQRDGDGVPTAIVSPDGFTTTLTIDANNHLTRITYPDNGYYTFEYTADGLMTTKIEPEANQFTHVFDAIGRLTDATDEEAGHWNFTRTAHENGDILTEVITGEGNLTSYLDHTDSTGAYTSTITDPTGAQTLFTLYANGLKVNKSLPCGMDLSFSYGLDSEYKFKFVKEMTEATPLGLAKTTLRNKSYQDTDSDETPDRITETVTVNGKATSLVTNTLQATKAITSPVGRTVTTNYDPNTLLTTSLAIPGLYDATYGYDITGRLTSIATNTRQTTFAYDAQGNLSSITDPTNETTSYSYDSVGRMSGISRPDTSSVGFTYDKNGNMTMVTNPSNIDHGFGYNKVNLNTAYDTPLSGSYSYVYDRDRRLTQVNFPSGRQINNFYTNGRLEQIQTPEGNLDLTYFCSTKVDSITKGTEEISYGYDGSLVTSENLSGNLNQSLTYGYNNDFNLTNFTYAGGSVGYTYDNDGLLTGAGNFAISRNGGNGLPESVTGGTLSLNHTFNSYGEVEGQNFTVGSQGLTSWSLTRDNAGRITAKTETIEGVTSNYLYTYDPMGRLLTVTKDGVSVEEYVYDTVGTRISEVNTLRGVTSRSYSYSDEDHLLTAGNAAYQFDLDGYLTTKTVGADVTSYTYSSRGELLSVNLPDGRTVEYIHDPLGRRIAKKVDGSITEKYLWQGLTRLLAVYDGSDNLIQRFLYADGRMPVAMERAGTTYYFTYDQVGSLRVVADSSGNVVKRINYNSFGNIIYDSAPSFEIPFGFAGGLHDKDTGLVRFGFRDYDPDTARWTAKDPILFAGGNVDLYGYCLNDPVNWIDPYGFSAVGDVYRGIITAVTEGAKGGVYSVGQAARDIGQLAIHGDPYVKTALGIAVVSEIVPLACAAGYYAAPTVTATTTATLANQAAIEFASDFVRGAIPSTAPPPTIGGALGTAANILYNKLF